MDQPAEANDRPWPPPPKFRHGLRKKKETAHLWAVLFLRHAFQPDETGAGPNLSVREPPVEKKGNRRNSTRPSELENSRQLQNHWLNLRVQTLDRSAPVLRKYKNYFVEAASAAAQRSWER